MTTFSAPPFSMHQVPDLIPGTVIPMGKVFALGRHDFPSRTLLPGFGLKQTNEIVVENEWDLVNKKVIHTNKVTVTLADTPWLPYFEKTMGKDLFHDEFKVKGFGWMDFNPPNTKLRYNNLSCGGNIYEVIGSYRAYTLIKVLDYNEPPPGPKINPILTPQYFTKQGVVGHNPITKETYWTIDKKPRRQDLYIPNVAPGGIAAIETRLLDFLPPLPLESNIGLITAYLIQASDTYGLVEGNWHPIELMPITGHANQDDRDLYINSWITTWRVPTIGATYGFTAEQYKARYEAWLNA